MYKEDGLTYLEDHELDVLERATLDEARHRLYNDRALLWEALGPDALPNDPAQSKRLEDAVAAALVDGDNVELGRLLANMALEFAFKSCHDQILDDWQRYVGDDGDYYEED